MDKSMRISVNMRLTAVIISFAMAFTTLTIVTSHDVYAAGDTAAKLKSAYESTLDFVYNRVNNAATKGESLYGQEWNILGLARSGKIDHNSVLTGTYYSSIETTVRKQFESSENKPFNYSSDYSKLIIILTALGYDPTNVAGYNLFEGINNYANVVTQGINGPVWALIALDSGNYVDPTPPIMANDKATEMVKVTREKLINAILGGKLRNGGWAFFGSTPDPDMTAMTITALAPYYNSNAEVKAAIDKGLDAICVFQDCKGGFPGGGESLAQVITAMASIGINPVTDERFNTVVSVEPKEVSVNVGSDVVLKATVKRISLLDRLCDFAVDGGGFRHAENSGENGLATAQCFYALTALYRFYDNRKTLYDMSDVAGGFAPVEAKLVNMDPGPVADSRVTWTSKDTSVANVTDGLVTGLAKGETKIVATTVVDGKKDSCKVTVVPKSVKNIPVKGVELDKSSLKLAKGKTKQLKATITPDNATNKNLKWKSNKPDVVSVDGQGNIKALKFGKATITVTTEDGQYSKTCTVTVANMTLKDPKLSFKTKAAAKDVKLTLSNDSIAKVKSSKRKVATVKIKNAKSGIITVKPGAANGTAKITVTSKAGIEVSFNVQVGKPTTTSLTLSPKTVTIKGINKKKTLKVTVKPAQKVTKEKVTVSVNKAGKNVIKATYSEKTGKITITSKKKGKATVTAKAGKKSATAKIVVK